MRELRTGSESAFPAQFGQTRLLQRVFRADETKLIFAYPLNF
jgi:hypothetical protein